MSFPREGKPQLEEKILSSQSEGPRNFAELTALTSATRADLVQALESLMAKGTVIKSSDGFGTIYSRRQC